VPGAFSWKPPFASGQIFSLIFILFGVFFFSLPLFPSPFPTPCLLIKPFNLFHDMLLFSLCTLFNPPHFRLTHNNGVPVPSPLVSSWCQSIFFVFCCCSSFCFFLVSPPLPNQSCFLHPGPQPGALLLSPTPSSVFPSLFSPIQISLPPHLFACPWCFVLPPFSGAQFFPWIFSWQFFVFVGEIFGVSCPLWRPQTLFH